MCITIILLDNIPAQGMKYSDSRNDWEMSLTVALVVYRCGCGIAEF